MSQSPFVGVSFQRTPQDRGGGVQQSEGVSIPFRWGLLPEVTLRLEQAKVKPKRRRSQSPFVGVSFQRAVGRAMVCTARHDQVSIPFRWGLLPESGRASNGMHCSPRPGLNPLSLGSPSRDPRKAMVAGMSRVKVSIPFRWGLLPEGGSHGAASGPGRSVSIPFRWGLLPEIVINFAHPLTDEQVVSIPFRWGLLPEVWGGSERHACLFGSSQSPFVGVSFQSAGRHLLPTSGLLVSIPFRWGLLPERKNDQDQSANLT